MIWLNQSSIKVNLRLPFWALECNTYWPVPNLIAAHCDHISCAQRLMIGDKRQGIQGNMIGCLDGWIMELGVKSLVNEWQVSGLITNWITAWLSHVISECQRSRNISLTQTRTPSKTQTRHTHLLQIQRDGHILKLTATLQRGRLPPALLEAAARRDQRLDGSLLGPVGAVRITGAAVLGPIAMRIGVDQFAVLLGSVLAARCVHCDRGTRRDIKQRRIEAASTDGLICLLSVAQAHF